MIDWINRKERVPKHSNEILAYGYIPSLAPGSGFSFLGVTKYYVDRFGLDGSGHFGLVRVTHWAEITPPNEAIKEK